MFPFGIQNQTAAHDVAASTEHLGEAGAYHVARGEELHIDSSCHGIVNDEDEIIILG